MTRVLVVDDSKFMRTVIGNALETAGYDVETASNGTEAVEAVSASDPDVVTMDVEMPELDGIQAVERIMATNPTVILMLSAHTESGATATLDALERGAVDFVHKPDTQQPGDRNIAHLADEVVEAVDELAEADVSSLALARTTASARATTARTATRSVTNVATAGAGETVSESVSIGETEPPRMDHEFGSVERAAGDESRLTGEDTDANPTIVIGASTGGPKIVERLLATLPIALEATVLVVQHMPAEFTARFADRLDSLSAYDVDEAADGDRLRPGEAAVAPGNSHLKVTADAADSLRVGLSDDDRIHGVRPAIDVTMRTAAQHVETPLCGVVLTGMGRDGAAGIEAIDAAGGTTIAQDEATSPVFGIPCQAIETGCIDAVAPANEIVDEIVDALVTDGEIDD